ncbi:MAG: FecR family protein [Stappiaceae bacterium]
MIDRDRKHGAQDRKQDWKAYQPILSCSVIVACLFLTMPAFGQSSENVRHCLVSSLSGQTVQIERGGAIEPATMGYSITLSDTIRTGEASRAEISCEDGIKITIAPQSVVNLGNLAGPAKNDQNILIELFSGIAGFIAPKRNWNSFEVRAPRAIASVRSTEWLVSADALKTSVFVRKGAVAVSPEGALAETLQVGQGMDIEQGMRAVSFPVKTWPQERVTQIGSELGFSWQ